MSATVRSSQAGKGGKVVKEKYGPNFYEQIGHMGVKRSRS